jgi:hypothetical protein
MADTGAFVDARDLPSPCRSCGYVATSKVGITLDLYSHVLPGMQAEAL